jgi:hypothetical protein
VSPRASKDVHRSGLNYEYYRRDVGISSLVLLHGSYVDLGGGLQHPNCKAAGTDVDRGVGADKAVTSAACEVHIADLAPEMHLTPEVGIARASEVDGNVASKLDDR